MNRFRVLGLAGLLFLAPVAPVVAQSNFTAPTGTSPDGRPPVDTPVLDPSPTQAGVGASDADRVGGLALGAVALLLLVAIASRRLGSTGSDICPVCASTLSFSGGESRCGRCGFRRLKGRHGETYFGQAAPAGIDPRPPAVASRPAPEIGEGGARGSW